MYHLTLILQWRYPVAREGALIYCQVRFPLRDLCLESLCSLYACVIVRLDPAGCDIRWLFFPPCSSFEDLVPYGLRVACIPHSLYQTPDWSLIGAQDFNPKGLSSFQDHGGSLYRPQATLSLNQIVQTANSDQLSHIYKSVNLHRLL